MKLYQVMLCNALFTLGAIAVANAATPDLNLEKKIAYQQGHFGALYATCGSKQENIVIGGTLANWRTETFRGYNGTAQERQALEASFDTAASDVKADAAVCKDWVKQVAATQRSIAYLATYGLPPTQTSQK